VILELNLLITSNDCDHFLIHKFVLPECVCKTLAAWQCDGSELELNLHATGGNTGVISLMFGYHLQANIELGVHHMHAKSGRLWRDCMCVPPLLIKYLNCKNLKTK